MVTHTIGQVDDLVPLKRVLISVSDKNGLDRLAPALVRACPDLEILSTGGTYRALQDMLPSHAGLRDVASYTGSPETDGGLVKTLDYKLYLGILGEMHNPLHAEDRRRTGAGLIDAVIVNLYPFTEAVAQDPRNAEQARSNVDIGGVTLLRAAAKNYLRVSVLSDPGEYDGFLQELAANAGSTTLRYRAGRAQQAFAGTAAYDTAISSWFSGVSPDDLASRYVNHG